MTYRITYTDYQGKQLERDQIKTYREALNLARYLNDQLARTNVKVWQGKTLMMGL